MSKKRNKIKNNENGGVRKVLETIFIGVSAGVAVAALVISILALNQQTKFEKAEYEYKRNPTFNVFLNGLGLQLEDRNGTLVANPVIEGFSIDLEDINNLDRVYIIAPDFSTEEIQSRETMQTDIDEKLIEQNVGKYFKRAYADGKPDMKFGDYWYFYRFFVFVTLDNEFVIQTFCYKTTPVSGTEETFSAFMSFAEVNFLEYEKAHLDDERYAGERQIAAQYREIKEYLAGMAIK